MLFITLTADVAGGAGGLLEGDAVVAGAEDEVDAVTGLPVPRSAGARAAKRTTGVKSRGPLSNKPQDFQVSDSNTCACYHLPGKFNQSLHAYWQCLLQLYGECVDCSRQMLQ